MDGKSPAPELAGPPGASAPTPPMSNAPPRLCPACLTENSPHFIFCQGCGRLLPQAAAGPGDLPAVVPSISAAELAPVVMPISLALVRAARATLYDSDSIRSALETVEAASRRLQSLTQSRPGGPPDEFVWERNASLAESSSLIEGAGALLALAAAPETRDSLRGLFIRRAYWVLQVARERTQGLLAKGER
ncbi:MAG: hypothetical protein L3J91_04605 [Thermoplasmata archaeon]|nr:hypothetical protein [Thermoplasmata archaeon]